MQTDHDATSKRAIIDTFHELFLNDKFDQVRIGQIISQADVGRTTFYEYFRNKEDLFRQACQPIVIKLAQTPFPEYSEQILCGLLEHFREVGGTALATLQSPRADAIVHMLAEETLSLVNRHGIAVHRHVTERSFVCLQIAEFTIGSVRAWLLSGVDLPSQALARNQREIAERLLDQLR
ncbi:MAG: TetR/AcrR family transcriptional regulator [Planctomycetales bacterium]|nr:TetR/AcrR family transcriptional regulator [Planctomycetales bacterium]